MSRVRRRWLWLVVVVAAVVAVIGIRLIRPREVAVEPVVRGRAVEAVYATGTVEPATSVVVRSRIAEHVAEIAVREGDRVTKGQLLARIENPVRGYALSQGETQLAKARAQAGPRSPALGVLEAQAKALRAQLALARIEHARTEKLAATGAVPRQELDASRARVDQLDAQLQAAEAQVRSTRVELAAQRDQLASQVKSLAIEADEGAVVAPTAGVVLKKLVEPGELVSANQALFEVADTSELIIELHVDEADIARMRDGRDASTVALSFYAFPGRAFAGTISRILPEPDRVRRSYTVEVKLDAPIPGIRVGMTAEANVIVRRKDNALLVPAEAVDGDRAWFVVDGRAEPRVVKTGIRDLVRVEIVDGARDGELAIVDRRGVTAGARVEPVVRGTR